MSKFFCDRALRSAPLSQPRRTRWQWGAIASLAVWSGSLGLATPLAAQSPAAAPADLKSLLTGLDAAANKQNVQSVAEFFSPNFTHSDGLNRQTLQESLTTLWKRYPNLTYRTELKSWKQDGSAIVADTVTYITGVKKDGDREFKLTSELAARQRVENQKIVNQEVLQERSQMTSGTNPPTLKISLPEQVRSGQEFTFDAIVQEPLGDDLLMGAALEEPIKPEGFLNVTTVNLEPLNSGGIFKVGRAPANPVPHWLSAVIVRHDGITMVTQRLRVQGR